MSSDQPQRFTVTVAAVSNGRVQIPVPFDPDTVWGIKPRHHIAGTINHMRARGVIEASTDGFGFTLGPAWLRYSGLAAGDVVSVEIICRRSATPTSPRISPLRWMPAPRPAGSSTHWPSSTGAATCAGSRPPNAARTCGPNASPA